MTNKNLVWYVGYGSNIFKDRFLCYITGGQPIGSQKNYEGSRDTELSNIDKPTTINNELYFSENSPSWQNGGVCFVNIEANSETSTLARMYLVTKQQLEDIAKQETNSQDYLTINFEEAISTGNTIFKTPSWYGNLLYLGYDNGQPVFTLTNQNNLTETTKPSVEYLQIIVKGIQQIHKLTKQEIVNYFIDKRGIRGNYTVDELKNLIENET